MNILNQLNQILHNPYLGGGLAGVVSESVLVQSGCGFALSSQSSLGEEEPGGGHRVVVVVGPGVHHGLLVVQVALGLHLQLHVHTKALAKLSLEGLGTGLGVDVCGVGAQDGGGRVLVDAGLHGGVGLHVVVVHINVLGVGVHLGAGVHGDGELARLGLQLHLGGEGHVGGAVDVDPGSQHLLGERTDCAGVAVVGVGQLLGQLQLGGGLADRTLHVGFSLQADQVSHLGLHDDGKTEVGGNHSLVGKFLEHVVVVEGVLSADLLHHIEALFLDGLQHLLLHHVNVSLVDFHCKVDVVAESEPGSGFELSVSPGGNLQLLQDFVQELTFALARLKGLHHALHNGVHS